MFPDRISNLGPLAHESDALPTELRGPATFSQSVGIEGILVNGKGRKKSEVLPWCYHDLSLLMSREGNKVLWRF